jgi:predicted DNA-binding protein (MmcQ/YjbR family)
MGAPSCGSLHYALQKARRFGRDDRLGGCRVFILGRMDAERAREFLLGLPHVVETQQWGDNLVFWVGDKAIGGKMFALLDLSGGGHGVVSYSAGPERFAELVERDGLIPAPYMARIHWVAAERWDALRNLEWEEELRAAHGITLAKLPKGVLAVLAMPEKQRKALIVERRKVLAARDEKACAAKAAKKAGAAKAKRG